MAVTNYVNADYYTAQKVKEYVDTKNGAVATALGAIQTWMEDADDKLSDVPDSAMSGTSEKAVQNKVVKAYVDAKLDADGGNADSSAFSIESNSVTISGGTEGTVSITELVDPTESHHAANKKYVDETIAAELDAFEHQDYKIVDTLPSVGESGVRYLLKIIDDPGPPEEFHMEEYMYLENMWRDCGRFDTIKEATDTVAGTVKLNPSESVTLNSNGQLVVGGRIGQYPDGGVFYPTNITPSGVGQSSFLMTDGAKGIALSGRSFGIMAGANITCKSAAAGSTQYRVSNTYQNRFWLFAVKGGRAALNKNDAAENGTVAITSIKFANGSDISVHFGANESSNDIIVTLSKTVNPSAATTTIRVYGTNIMEDNIVVGQGVGASSGKAISLGQATYAGGNQTVAIGNSVHVMANNSVGFGHTMLVNKQYCFGAGQGHNFTSGANGTAALGTWSQISSNTKLAIGNGTANETRSNIFEVTDDSGQTGVILKAPNGTRYKLRVDNDGTLSTVAV